MRGDAERSDFFLFADVTGGILARFMIIHDRTTPRDESARAHYEPRQIPAPDI